MIATDSVFSAPREGKILKLRCNENVTFLSRGEYDTPSLALKRIDKLLISIRYFFFSREHICLELHNSVLGGGAILE